MTALANVEGRLRAASTSSPFVVVRQPCGALLTFRIEPRSLGYAFLCSESALSPIFRTEGCPGLPDNAESCLDCSAKRDQGKRWLHKRIRGSAC